MVRSKALVTFLLILVVIAIAITIIMLLVSNVAGTFSTIGSCLDCTPPPSLAEPSEDPPAAGGEEPGPLDEIDALLQRVMTASIAYNAPSEMQRGESVTIELLLDRNLPEEELKKQITAPGTVFSSAGVKITDEMEARIFSKDQEAFSIQALQEPRQLISNVEATKWLWYVTAKKEGKQKLSVVLYRVIEYEGEEIPRIIKEYESDIDVRVTPLARLQSLDWKWFAAGALLLLLAIPAFVRQYGRRTNPTSSETGLSKTGSRNAKIPGSIFISYRRSDSADIAGRIYDRLVDDFGREPIFKDVDSIPLGTDFREYLDRKVGECLVFLAIIGDRWSDARDAAGKRRLEDPDDFVRIEIESALERDIPVIPLLVRGAQIPDEESLPPSLRKLVYKNGMPVRPDPDFHNDMDRLISELVELFDSGQG